ncbi:hypothetical protein [Caproiciproducens faecalis]|uniref:Ethanolamine utilization protein n=1 Tax=Caproiciproducens faecalis TaxID=2820301 RepID=A0ABS7DLW4_9FIRM|nr:hypothetical protein [Caproiciproducens faecalis]MBW7572287.1 hypothetical protein [Caproiciproducens faecalis]
MEISENDLYQIVLKVIQKMQNGKMLSNFPVPEQKLYVILSEGWNEEYRSFFNTLKDQRKYCVTTVIPPSMANDYHQKKLREWEGCGTVLRQDQTDLAQLPDGTTVFPAASRELIVKTALCIGDTFETKWVQRCMANGQKIILLKSGLEPLTGREPAAYAARIKAYYRIIAQYGIEIKETVFEEETAPENLKHAMSRPAPDKRAYGGHQVITEGDLDKFVQEGRILLAQGDLLTALAKEKASCLGIEIIRQ